MVWNLARDEEFLPRSSMSELKKMMTVEKSAKPRLRLLIAVHRKKGWSIDRIAQACGVARRTVHGTLQRFQERGVNAAHALKQSGRPKRLGPKQLKNLRKRLLESPLKNGFSETFWDTKMILSLVEKNYRVVYDISNLRRLLHDLGFSCKKPRPRHYKSNPLEVESFKKKLENKSLKQKESGEARFVWTSAVSSSRPMSREVGLSVENQLSR